MLKVETRCPLPHDDGTRMLGGTKYLLMNKGIFWDKFFNVVGATAVEEVYGAPLHIYNREKSRVQRRAVYDTSEISIGPIFSLFVPVFCKGIRFSGRVKLAEGVEKFVSLDHTGTYLEAKDGFLLQYYAEASRTEVDIYRRG
jgi:hypothetical protein